MQNMEQDICANASQIRDADTTIYGAVFGIGGWYGTHLNLSTIRTFNEDAGTRLENISMRYLKSNNFDISMNELCYKLQKKSKKNLCTSADMGHGNGPGGCCVTVVNQLNCPK